MSSRGLEFGRTDFEGFIQGSLALCSRSAGSKFLFPVTACMVCDSGATQLSCQARPVPLD